MLKKEFFKSHEFKSVVAIVLSLVLVFGIVFLLTKKAAVKTASTTNDVSHSDDGTQNVETTVLHTKKQYDSYKKLNVRLEGVSVTDQGILQKMILHILDYPYDLKYPLSQRYDDNYAENYFEDFDSTSPSAYSFAMEHIFTPYLGMVEMMEYWYGWPSVKHVKPTNEETQSGQIRIDPLHRFEVDSISGYGVIDEKYIDAMLKYIFDQTPDHSFVLKDYEGNCVEYYLNGKYYYNSAPGGDGAIPLILFNSFKKVDDGSFEIDAVYVVTTDGDEIVERSVQFTIVTKPVEYEGQVLWTIYKLTRK